MQDISKKTVTSLSILIQQARLLGLSLLTSAGCFAHNEPVTISEVIHSRSPASTASPSEQEPSRFPAGISDGFELKILSTKMTAAIWVYKHDEQFELVYTNSHGSRSSLSLTPEVYARLQSTVQSFKPTTLNLSRCPDANIRLNYVQHGKAGRPVVSCANAKGAEAERLKSFSQSILTLVQ